MSTSRDSNDIAAPSATKKPSSIECDISDLKDLVPNSPECSKLCEKNANSPRVLRVHLPNQQRTSVRVRSGVSLRDALSKALARRALSWGQCEVTINGDVVIPWDSDMTSVADGEVAVRTLACLPVLSHISHDFARIVALTSCDCCHQLLFYGLHCSQCGVKFHADCAQSVPRMCYEDRIPDLYFAALLAQPVERQAAILHLPPHFFYTTNNNNRTPCRKPRAGSAPDVGYNAARPTPQPSRRKHSQPAGPAHALVRRLLSSWWSWNGDHAQRRYHRHPEHAEIYPRHNEIYPRRTSWGTGQPQRPRARSLDAPAGGRRSRPASLDDGLVPAHDIVAGQRLGRGSFGPALKAHCHGSFAANILKEQTPNPAQAFKNEEKSISNLKVGGAWSLPDVVLTERASAPSLTAVAEWREGPVRLQRLLVLDVQLPMASLAYLVRHAPYAPPHLHTENTIRRAPETADWLSNYRRQGS